MQLLEISAGRVTLRVQPEGGPAVDYKVGVQELTAFFLHFVVELTRRGHTGMTVLWHTIRGLYKAGLL